MTEPGDLASALSLDVVRARIFYLASDVEPISPPAAMLLRAVADAIEGSGNAGEGADASEHSISNGELAGVVSKIQAARPLGSRVQENSERSFGVGLHPGYKR